MTRSDGSVLTYPKRQARVPFRRTRPKTSPVSDKAPRFYPLRVFASGYRTILFRRHSSKLR